MCTRIRRIPWLTPLLPQDAKQTITDIDLLTAHRSASERSHTPPRSSAPPPTPQSPGPPQRALSPLGAGGTRQQYAHTQVGGGGGAVSSALCALPQFVFL